MGRRNRIVKPKTRRIEISDGDWIEVKQELSAGEQRDLVDAASSPTALGETPEIQATAWGFALIESYVVGWSLEDEDDDGNIVKLNIDTDTIRALDRETFSEIREAVSNHIETENERKKAPTGSPLPEPTLRS